MTPSCLAVCACGGPEPQPRIVQEQTVRVATPERAALGTCEGQSPPPEAGGMGTTAAGAQSSRVR